MKAKFIIFLLAAFLTVVPAVYAAQLPPCDGFMQQVTALLEQHDMYISAQNDIDGAISYTLDDIAEVLVGLDIDDCVCSLLITPLGEAQQQLSDEYAEIIRANILALDYDLTQEDSLLIMSGLSLAGGEIYPEESLDFTLNGIDYYTIPTEWGIMFVAGCAESSPEDDYPKDDYPMDAYPNNANEAAFESTDTGLTIEPDGD